MFEQNYSDYHTETDSKKVGGEVRRPVLKLLQ